MTRKRLSKHLRWAIYIEHGRKCSICDEPAKYKEIEIEHLIPVALLKEQERYFDLLNKLGLPTSFDINGIPNLFPSHPKCNNLKSNQLLGLPLLQLALRRGFSREEQIISRVSKLNEDFKRAYYSEHPNFIESRDGSLSTRLSLPVEFAEISDEIFHRVDELDKIMDLEICSPVLEMEDNSGKGSQVSTLSSYMLAVQNGLTPNCNLMGKMANRYENAIKIILAHKQAQPPLDSHISNPRVGVNDLELMPVSNINFGEDGGEDDHPSPSEAVNSGYIRNRDTFRVDMVSSTSLTYWHPHLSSGRWYKELARFDFNNSGYEQILAIEGYYCSGTHSFSDVIVIKRESADSLFIIEEFNPDDFSELIGTPNPFVTY